MEISEIKHRLTLDQVLRTYSLTPDRNHRLICPWHDDKTPSLQIYPKTNTWTCFSSNCDAGTGDQIDFIMRYEKILKHEALLKAKALIDPNYASKTQLSTVAILTKYYQGSLHAMQRSKKAQAYANGRGLHYEQLGIGFCAYQVGKSWNKDLQANAEKLGLYNIKNCLIFPTKNKQSQIVSIYGRAVSDSSKSKHFYLAGGFRGLYPKWPPSNANRIILTESVIDAATLSQHVEEPVLALYGTNGFTKDHEQAIRGLDVLEEVILFFDGDEAGKAAVKKYADQLQRIKPNIKISYIDTPEGEDPNSLVQTHEPEILQHLIDNRLFFSIESVSTDRHSIEKKNTPNGKLDVNNPELILYYTDLLSITILGGIKVTGLDRMRITVKIERNHKSHHLPVRHSLDLYHSKQVEQLVQKIAESLEISSSQAEKTISDMTGALERYRQNKLEQLKPKKTKKPAMTQADKAEAIKYLKKPKLLRNTLTDIAKSGIVGEKE